MNGEKNAVGYVRCSTEMQEDSPAQQKKEIITFAESKSINIIEWFVDFGESGTTFQQRAEFMGLKRDVENNPNFAAVICYDESRWGRAIDAEENTFWRAYFRKYGVEVLLVKTPIDPRHEFAPMMKAFEGVQASSYSKKLSELTKRRAMSNGPYSNGGTAPYGYRRIAVNPKTGQRR
jgi:DNA invertase Pin-like site-specific DNA recombinase